MQYILVVIPHYLQALDNMPSYKSGKTFETSITFHIVKALPHNDLNNHLLFDEKR